MDLSPCFGIWISNLFCGYHCWCFLFFFKPHFLFHLCQGVSKTKFICKSTGEWINKLWCTHTGGILCINELLIQQQQGCVSKLRWAKEARLSTYYIILEILENANLFIVTESRLMYWWGSGKEGIIIRQIFEYVQFIMLYLKAVKNKLLKMIQANTVVG